MKPKLWLAPLAARSGNRPAARPRRHAAARQGRRAAERDLVGQLLSVPGLSGDGGMDYGALVRKIMGEWGYAGLKLDGQHLNGVAPCYNPAHKHARPEESVEKLQDFWKAIHDGGDRDQSGRGDRDLPLRHLVRLSQHALHEPGGRPPIRCRPGRSAHKGKTIKALMGPVGRLCRRPCGAQRQWR